MQYRNEHGNIVTEITKKPEKRKGYFHIWASKQWTVGDSPFAGGYSKGQMSQVVGIVEYEDGTVHEHLPSEIRFTDREVRDGGDI